MTIVPTPVPPLNPGSQAALRAGCKCSPSANQYGRGVGESACGRAIYTVTPDCPLHGEHREREAA